MKPLTHIAFSSGHLFEIPTEVIAKNRAQAMLAAHPDEFKTLDEAMEDTVGLFEDNYSIEDWARNNMNWDKDLQPFARLVRFTPQDFDHVNGADWSHHDNPAMVAELSGETILRSPVEAVISAMAVSGQLCNMTVLHQPDETGEAKPYAAIALIIGNENVVGAYAQAFTLVGNALSAASPATTH